MGILLFIIIAFLMTYIFIQLVLPKSYFDFHSDPYFQQNEINKRLAKQDKFINDLKINPKKALSNLDITYDDIKFLEKVNSGQVKTKKPQARRISSTTSKTLQKGNKKKRSRNKKIAKRTRVRSK